MERIAKIILHRHSKNMGKYASLLNYGNPNKTKKYNERLREESFPFKIMDRGKIKNSG